MSIYSSNLNTPVYDYVQRLDEISAELALRAAKAADTKRGISAIDARFARTRNIQQADSSKREAIKRNRQAMEFYSYSKKKEKSNKMRHMTNTQLSLHILLMKAMPQLLTMQ